MARDYSTLGLNDKLQAVDSIAARDSGYVNNLDFDSFYEAVGGGKLSYGNIRSRLYIGFGTADGYVLFDGDNNRIVVHDGTTNRVVIGSV